jgi:hypothetical protein
MPPTTTTATTTPTAPPPPAEIWILAGQSNCTGWNGQDGTPGLDPLPAPADQNVLMLSPDGEALTPASEPTHLGVWGFDDAKAVGPGLSFARALQRGTAGAAPTTPVLVLVPCARGGASLCDDWSPDAEDDAQDDEGGPVDTRSGSLFGGCARRTRRALELATSRSSAALPPRLAGLVWIQGESDGAEGREAAARGYGPAFLAFLQRLERALGQHLPVVVMAAMAARGRDAAFPWIRLVREEQLRLAAEAEAARRRKGGIEEGRAAAPPPLARIWAVDMAGHEFYPDGGQEGSLVHLTRDGAVALGTALALKAATAEAEAEAEPIRRREKEGRS